MMKERRLCMVGLGSFMPRETSLPPCQEGGSGLMDSCRADDHQQQDEKRR